MTDVTALGIDFGHSYSCLGLFRGGEVSVIANEDGNRSTPALFAFNEREALLGEAAHSQIAINLSNTIHHVKKILGLPYSHPLVQEMKAKVDYRIEEHNGMPVFAVQFKGEEKRLTPSELVTTLLTKLRVVAERFCGHEVSECVIAAPSFFTQEQRTALVDASKAAGLNILAVLNEAVAAAMAFNLDKPEVSPKRAQQVVVVDIGGATSTVTLMSVEAGRFITRHNVTDVHCGGDDIDEKLVQHFAQDFKKRTGLDMTANHRAMTRLSVACEKAKRVLSSTTTASVECDALFEGEDLFGSVTRAKFEGLAGPVFRKMTGLIRRLFDETGVPSTQIDHVLLIGGSTRIPRLFDMIKSTVGKEPTKLINPEEAVAQGCAIQASLLSKRTDEWHAALNNKDNAAKMTKTALRMSISVEGDDGIAHKVLFKHQPLPAIASFEMKLPVSQSPFLVNLVEGEHALASKNHQLGTLVLNNKTDAEITVKAVIIVNAQREVTVTAQTEKLVLSTSLPSVDESRVASLEVPEKNDSVLRSLSASRSSLLSFIAETEASHGKNDKMAALLSEARSWLSSHPLSGAPQDDDIYADKRQSLDEAVDAVNSEIASSGAAHGSLDDIDDIDEYMARQTISADAEGGEHPGMDLDLD